MTSPTLQRLVLRIRPDDLVRIRAAQLRLVLARSSTAEPPAVIWESFDPFEINTITWSEGAYGVYAATAQLEPGTWLAMVSLLEEAQASYYYAFTASAVFAGPYWDSAIGADRYGVQNAMPASSYPQLAFGLSLAATLNGTELNEKPVSAQAVLATRLATFGDLPRLHVWLESGASSSTVISQVGANAAMVDTSRATTTTLIYDPDLGRFVPEPPSAGADERR